MSKKTSTDLTTHPHQVNHTQIDVDLNECDVLPEVVDGVTLHRHPTLGVTYRSNAGPLLEIEHVFHQANLGTPTDPQPSQLRQALQQLKRSSLDAHSPAPLRLTILEYGFGCGTTFCHTLRWWEEFLTQLRSIAYDDLSGQSTPYIIGDLLDLDVRLDYYTIDRDLLPPSSVEYPEARLRQFGRELRGAHILEEHLEVRKQIINYPHLQATLITSDFLDFEDDIQADAIFFDPFDLRVNPDGWSLDVFKHAFVRLAPQGRLSTYAAATRIRATMAKAGFQLAVRPGAHPLAKRRKREMTVAAKCCDALKPYKILPVTRFLKETTDT